ncbi:glycosyl transferase family 1, partial [Mycobacterium numidiamassiliense]
VGHRVSGSLNFGILSTYPPAPCGLATFSAALARELTAHGADVSVVQVSDGSPSSSARVIGELISGSTASVAACSDLLNQSDIAVIQHDYDIYGGVDGDDVVGVMDGLRVPSIVIAHTVLKNPSRHQRSVLEAVATRADQVIVMSDAASERLRDGFDIDRRKVSTIPHGATLPTNSCVRGGRPTVLTWGLLRPGMGVERVIAAMGSVGNLPGRPRYVVAGPTHPKVAAAEGDAYRDALIEQARRSGVADSVRFEPGYRNVAMLTALVQSAAVVVVPYDSTDQAVSGVLVEAVACGRPVVATAFPHAVELLSGGAGIVVAHDDPDALASALTRVLTEPRLAGTMAAEARRMAPEMSWPVVASAYVGVARRVLAQRQALV